MCVSVHVRAVHLIWCVHEQQCMLFVVVLVLSAYNPLLYITDEVETGLDV